MQELATRRAVKTAMVPHACGGEYRGGEHKGGKDRAGLDSCG